MNILTDEEIIDARKYSYGTCFVPDDFEFDYARAIESAVLAKLEAMAGELDGSYFTDNEL